MNIKYISFAAIILSYTTAHSITIEEAIIAAGKNNKGWAGNQADKKISDEVYDMSKKMFLPNVEAFLDCSRSKNEKAGHDYAGHSMPNDINFETGTRVGVRVNQNLFNGLQTVNTVHGAKLDSEAAFHKLRSSEQKLVLNVIEAYANVWFGMKKVDALRKKEANFQKTLASQENHMDVGVSTPSEVAEASANYQKAIYERIAAEAELFSAESEFEKLTGLKVTDDINLPNIKFDLPESLDKLIAKAMESNSSIIAAKLQEKSALKTLNATKGRLSPSCDLSLSASRDLSKKINNKESQNNYVATLEVKVPIFTNSHGSGNTFSQINIDNQKALKAKFEAEDTVLEVKKDCVITWNNYISANAMIQASRSAVKSAELSSESNLEETALGMKSNTDVWVKENNLLESRVNLAQSLKQKMVAAVKLLELTGKLSMKSLVPQLNNKKKMTAVTVQKN